MSKKYRIIYIINSLNVGGAQVGLCRLLNGLNPAEFEVHIFVLNDYDQNIINRLPDWVTYDIIDRSIINGVKISGKLIKKVRSADVIVGSLYHATVLARLLGTINTNSTVATWQHNEKFKNRRRQKLIGLTNGLSDVVLADSEHVAEVYQNMFDVGPEFVQTVPIAGLDLDQYSQKHHQPCETIRVGSVGSLTKQKNFISLIQVAEKMQDEDIQFQIAGDGPERNRLEDEIARRDLENILFLGEIDSVTEFLSQIEIYVQPSIWEGLCITVIEAMAAGLPVIGSDTGGIKKNVHHGNNGFICKVDDLNCIADAIRALKNDPGIRNDFGSYGYDLVQSKYTRSILVSQFTDSVINSKH